MKYKPTGEEEWVVRYKGEGTDIAVDKTGKVYVTGESDGDYSTMKYDAAGTMQWIEFYNGPGSSYDRAASMTIDTIGNIYITGASVGLAGFDDYATVKYNSIGSEEWIVRYNGPANLNDRPVAIAVDRLGNVYVTGSSDSIYVSSFFYSHEITDYATIKYNSSGKEEWVARVTMEQEMALISLKPLLLIYQVTFM